MIIVYNIFMRYIKKYFINNCVYEILKKKDKN